MHWYGFSSVWVIIFLSRLLLVEKVFFTQGALIVFLHSMSPYMRVKINCPWKCFITMGALKWFLPSMSHHMPAKTTFLWEWCITQGALIWFLPITSFLFPFLLLENINIFGYILVIFKNIMITNLYHYFCGMCVLKN